MSEPNEAAAPAARVRHFLSYRGTGLPLELMEELEPDSLRHRNTWFRAGYAADGRMLWVEKWVYGEVEMRHDYSWSDQGHLRQVRVQQVDEDDRVLDLAVGSAGS